MDQASSEVWPEATLDPVEPRGSPRFDDHHKNEEVFGGMQPFADPPHCRLDDVAETGTRWLANVSASGDMDHHRTQNLLDTITGDDSNGKAANDGRSCNPTPNICPKISFREGMLSTCAPEVFSRILSQNNDFLKSEYFH